MRLTDAQVRGLLNATRETREEELDCDQFLAVMAAYAEAKLAGGPLPAELSAAAAHERLCANCREECGAVLDILAVAPTLP